MLFFYAYYDNHDYYEIASHLGAFHKEVIFHQSPWEKNRHFTGDTKRRRSFLSTLKDEAEGMRSREGKQPGRVSWTRV